MMDASFCRLADIGVLDVTGADARPFLHGQLSIDVDALGRDAAPLAAWSAANGRVRALVRVVPLESGYALLAPESMTDTLVGKLGMFVLRADVTIRPSATLVLGAVLDATREWRAARGLTAAGDRNRIERVGGVCWIHAGERLSYVLAAEAELGALAAMTAPAARAAIELAEIELGLPQIVPATAERFLPQMLDLDRLGGIAFDKGCFPGQEVIARTRNLGTVKRRPRRFAAATASPPEPGTALCTAAGDEAGRTLRAAAGPERIELLAVVQLDALTAPLHLGDAGGPALTEIALEPARDVPASA